MEDFMHYWANYRPNSNQIPDAAANMHRAYLEAYNNLDHTKKRTIDFLVPHNNGKAWAPAFDPDRIKEVAALGLEIDQKRAAVKSIAEDIESFVAVVGGPTINILEDELNRAERRLQSLTILARKEFRKTSKLQPHASPVDVQNNDAVLDANAALAQGQEELEPKIADLRDRLEKARAILRKYGGN